MQTVIVLVNLAPGTENQTVSALKGMVGLVEVYQLYGLYDLLLIVKGEDEQSIKSSIMGELRSNKNITSTITMKVLD
jgi:DNA-binding Lrp family transcriptional regulator